MMKKIFAGVLLASLALTAIAPATVSAAGNRNIVENAIAINSKTGDFDTLIEAATCDYFGGAVANLLATADGITLFAPTDEAFAQLSLDSSNVCSLPSADLLNILAYHITSEINYGQLIGKAGGAITMLNGAPAGTAGDPADVAFFRGRVTVDGSQVVPGQVRASNGRIMVVQSVLLPPA